MDTVFKCCQCGDPTQKRLNLGETGFFSLCDKKECKKELWRDLLRNEMYNKDTHEIQSHQAKPIPEFLLLWASVAGIFLLIGCLLVIRCLL